MANRDDIARQILCTSIDQSITTLEAIPPMPAANPEKVCEFHEPHTQKIEAACKGVKTLLEIEKFRFQTNGENKGFWYNIGRLLRGVSRV